MAVEYNFELRDVIEGEIYTDPRDISLHYAMIPSAKVNKEYLKYLNAKDLESLAKESNIVYLPLPAIRGHIEVNYNGEIAFKVNSLGDNSVNFKYTNDQLKYLAWEATLGLHYIHSWGFVHGSISPETPVPSARRVCLAGFNPKSHGTHLQTHSNIAFASNEILQVAVLDYYHDMHSLAYTIIVLGGGVLPWIGASNEQDIIQTRLYYSDMAPKDFVNMYSKIFEQVLIEWLTQALSLQSTANSHFLNYLWN